MISRFLVTLPTLAHRIFAQVAEYRQLNPTAPGSVIAALLCGSLAAVARFDWKIKVRRYYA